MNSSVEGGGEEDTEDSSSSSSLSPNALNDLPEQFRSALDEFREKWQKELKSSDLIDKAELRVNNQQQQQYQKNKDLTRNNVISNGNTISDDENRAKTYFLQGIEYEKRGKVYDALEYYRRAIQIVPDIEFRIYEVAKSQNLQQETNNNNIIVSNDTTRGLNTDCNPNDEEDLSDVDLKTRFQYDVAVKDDGKLISSSLSVSGLIKTGAHISDLPMEIILYILRWVVSSKLDLRSLEQCARVCKGFYLCARDDEIWKSACLKVWGVNTGLLKNSQYSTWRQMFIERHRIHFDGCYISKTSYLRYGENSFQDQFYRPVQLIEYYRYLRFFPDGTVIMMTTADEPAQSVNKLNNLHQLRNDALKGHYRIHGDLIVIMLKRYQKSSFATKRLPTTTVTSSATSSLSSSFMAIDSSNNGNGTIIAGGNCSSTSGSGGNNNGSAIHTFYIELKILNSSKRRFCQLHWKHYSIIQFKNKKEISTDFELTTAKYPPLWFSRVRSYQLESDMPLN